ncbi:hypothetical protein BO86DRAFT_300133, partial [Aspergillus japonicus CBS 114.51]
PNKWIYPRPDTVSKLADAVDSYDRVLVRGTPATGKTTLRELLHNYYLDHHRTVYWLPSWAPMKSRGRSPWRQFSRRLRRLYPEFDETWASVPRKTVILIDEAQGSYHDAIFWNTVIKDHSFGLCPASIKICLFAHYGDPVTAVEWTDEYCPARWNGEMHVTLTPQPGRFSPCSPDIGLLYTESEFREVVTHLTAVKFDDKFAVDDTAMDYLYKLTSAHPGVVTAVVEVLYTEHRDLIKQGKIHTITMDHALEVLKDKGQFFRSLMQYAAGRSFPDHHDSTFTSKVVDVLGQILAKGSIRFDIKDVAMRTCYERGWAHRSSGLEWDEDENVLVLPSHVHEM